MDTKNEFLTLAVPSAWGPLTPPEQCTYAASEILGNVFETLVAYDLYGNLIPQLAQSWKVSPDLCVYTFTLNIKRKFSDGTPLTAKIIKKAFEHALTVSPTSHNQSALDLFYRLEGFEEFQTTKSLRGIEIPTKDTFVMKFKTPLRQALTFLTGIRYGIYIINTKGTYLGTGSYVFDKVSDQEVLLSANTHAQEPPAFPKARIIGLETAEFGPAIKEHKADVFWTVDPEKFLDKKEENLQHTQTSGSVAAHAIIAVNGMNGRIFSDQKLRQALQYLIVRESSSIHKDYFDLSRVTLDSQYLLPLQPGRLSQNEVNKIIEVGKEWVPLLIKASQEKPVYFPLRNEKDKIMTEMLQKEGISIKTSHMILSTKEALHLIYKTHDYDLISWRIGFGSIDPDSIYHALGQYGAISTPPIGRPRVWMYLEEGRSTTNIEKLNEIYTQLSYAILEEIPAVHVGYCRPFIFFNSDNIKMNIQRLNNIRFHLGVLNH